MREVSVSCNAARMLSRKPASPGVTSRTSSASAYTLYVTPERTPEASMPSERTMSL